MTTNKIEVENNNKDVKPDNDSTQSLKVFEVSTNQDEIITIKKEPLDFVEYNVACGATANPGLKEQSSDKQQILQTQNGSQGSSESLIMTVSYEVEDWSAVENSTPQLTSISAITATKRNLRSSSSKDGFVDDGDEEEEGESDDDIDVDEDGLDFEDEDIDLSDIEEDEGEDDEIEQSPMADTPLSPTTASPLSNPDRPSPGLDEETDEESQTSTIEYNGMKIESNRPNIYRSEWLTARIDCCYYLIA